MEINLPSENLGILLEGGYLYEVLYDLADTYHDDMPQIASAQGPVVSQDELKQALLNASRTRKENLDQVRSFLSSDQSREAFKTAHIDSDRVQKVVSSLDDTELSKLADQTRHIQNDFAAGALTNQQLTYIVIALATAVIVLIAVH